MTRLLFWLALAGAPRPIEEFLHLMELSFILSGHFKVWEFESYLPLVTIGYHWLSQSFGPDMTVAHQLSHGKLSVRVEA